IQEPRVAHKINWCESPRLALPRNILKPYASLVILLCPDGIDPESAFGQINSKLQKIRKVSQSRPTISVVAEGLDPTGDGQLDSLGEFDQFAITVHRVESRPGWLRETVLTDVRHELTVAFRRDRLIAVHLPASIRDAFQTWLDKPPRPMVRRLASEVLERALLKGESRGLWLRGTHSPQKTKPDSKNIVGPDLRQTLSPVEDQTYALGSGRSLLPSAPSRVALTGTVGTTPTRSLVWNKATEDFDEFAQCALELLELLWEEITKITEGAIGDPAFPLLTQPVFDFDNVWGAYDISCANPVNLPDDTNDDKVSAAITLESAVLNIHGKDDSSDFELDIGRNMSVGGVMRGRLLVSEDSAQLRLGLKGNPTDHTLALPVRDALDHTDLLTVYYASGHVFTQGTLYKPQITPYPFPNWRWGDFVGYSISKEKPGTKDSSPAEIHEMIGKDNDHSLFAWVLSVYPNGWLTCDDGSGELADFIHVSDDDFTISFIHVKGAANDSDRRGVSAASYEVVTSQAVKNTYFMKDSTLVEHLKSAPVPTPATWIDGLREDDRSGLIEAIAERDARSKYEVVIVQPHVRRKTYEDLYLAAKRAEKPSADLLRLRRLENILNGGRPTMTGMGADLFVIGCL
ncbi:hypothetical protein, partial [Pseudonocardia aurantiaca]